MELLEKTQKFVVDSFEKVGKQRAVPHLYSAIEWLKKLRPDADEAMLIAVFAHDIDRPFTESNMNEYIAGVSLKEEHIVERHQKHGASIMREFLAKHEAPSELIDRVEKMIAHHEVGGDPDSDAIKDADSLSFFECNAKWMISWMEEGMSKEQIREKYDWMFNRISSEKAKEWAKPMYDEAVKLLEKA